MLPLKNLRESCHFICNDEVTSSCSRLVVLRREAGLDGRGAITVAQLCELRVLNRQVDQDRSSAIQTASSKRGKCATRELELQQARNLCAPLRLLTRCTNHGRWIV